jgi:hypothetical protein
MYFMSCAAVIEVRIMPWPDHVALMGETINAESIIREGRRPLAKTRYRCEDNFKTDVKEVARERGLV